MAKATIELINALRLTAENLRNGAYHSWGHHGACNCGNLVQSVTKFSKEEILQYAHTGTGEWTELAMEYCPSTSVPLALVFSKLEKVGLTPTDIHHIEYLSDREILEQLPGGFRWLRRNKREDAIAYFETFADILEQQWLLSVDVDVDKIISTVNLERSLFLHNSGNLVLLEIKTDSINRLYKCNRRQKVPQPSTYHGFYQRYAHH